MPTQTRPDQDVQEPFGDSQDDMEFNRIMARNIGPEGEEDMEENARAGLGWAEPNVNSKSGVDFNPTKQNKSDTAEQLANRESGATDEKKDDDLVKSGSELSKLSSMAPGAVGVAAKAWGFAKSHKGMAGGGAAGIAIMFGIMIFFSGTYMMVMSRQGWANKTLLPQMFVSKRSKQLHFSTVRIKYLTIHVK